MSRILAILTTENDSTGKPGVPKLAMRPLAAGHEYETRPLKVSNQLANLAWHMRQTTTTCSGLPRSTAHVLRHGGSTRLLRNTKRVGKMVNATTARASQKHGYNAVCHFQFGGVADRVRFQSFSVGPSSTKPARKGG